MRTTFLLIAGLFAVPLSAQQGLVCPAAAVAGRPCEVFHYHVGMYRPDTKQFVEVFGGNQFSSQAACDRAREAQMSVNLKVVGYFKGVREQQYEPDRFGPCHCDMTVERGSANFLTDAQRVLQLRGAEEIRLRVRERLLDNGLTTESETVRGLWSEPPATALVGGTKIVPMPQGAGAPALTSPEDLKATRSLDTTKPSVAALDLPLIDLSAPQASQPDAPQEAAPGATATSPSPVVTPVPAPTSAPAAEAPMETVDVPAPAPVETHTDSQPEHVVQAQDAPTEEEVQSAQETAERFITYETQRIQNVLRASAAIADETVKSKIFEACMQRIQLLSNLRLLIEGSGMRSRLAEASRQAESETARLALMSRLFGEGIAPHWAPKDAADVVFEIESDVAAAPERALRDTTGRFSVQQKKQALYLVLAQTQPTEDQRLWLSALVEGFLK
jgi:hypothetical protein